MATLYLMLPYTENFGYSDTGGGIGKSVTVADCHSNR